MLSAYLIHVLGNNLLNLYPDVTASDLELLKLDSHQFKYLNQNAACLNYVKIVDEDIDLVGLKAFLLYMVQKLPGVPQLEVF